MPEDNDKERIPPEQQRVLNACDHHGEEEGERTLTQERVTTARSQGMYWGTYTRQRANLARGQVTEEG